MGAVGLDGGVVGGSTLVATGTFRTAVLSHDGRYVAYATSGGRLDRRHRGRRRATGRRAGRSSRRAVGDAFDPVGDTLATIAATKVVKDAPSVPLGPMRLVDPASGAVRTLFDDAVVAFFWSPDGRTIAALQTTLPNVGPVAGTGGSNAAGAVRSTTAPGAASRAVLTSAGPPQDESDRTAASVGVDAGLVFIDVATGAVRSRQTVRLADHFVGAAAPLLRSVRAEPPALVARQHVAAAAARDEGRPGPDVVIPADGSAPATDRRRRQGLLEPLTVGRRSAAPEAPCRPRAPEWTDDRLAPRGGPAGVDDGRRAGRADRQHAAQRIAELTERGDPATAGARPARAGRRPPRPGHPRVRDGRDHDRRAHRGVATGSDQLRLLRRAPPDARPGLGPDVRRVPGVARVARRAAAGAVRRLRTGRTGTRDAARGRRGDVPGRLLENDRAAPMRRRWPCEAVRLYGEADRPRRRGGARGLRATCWPGSARTSR